MKHLRSAVAGPLVCLTTILLESVPAAAGPARDLGSLVPVPDGVTASFAVYGRKNQEFTAMHDPHIQFRMCGAGSAPRAGERCR
ncbi:MAG: hypothetical protein ACRDS0_04810 [Pseudonocardiaceae bacterium]